MNSPLERAVDQVVDDIRVCHEFYCKYNCGGVLPTGTHTLRCQRLQREYDLPKQKSGMHLPKVAE